MRESCDDHVVAFLVTCPVRGSGRIMSSPESKTSLAATFGEPDASNDMKSEGPVVAVPRRSATTRSAKVARAPVPRRSILRASSTRDRGGGGHSGSPTLRDEGARDGGRGLGGEGRGPRKGQELEDGNTLF